MRGDLDDALARLARRDQLLRRTGPGAHQATAAVNEIAAAVRHVVQRHPGLSATVRLEGVGPATEVRVGRHAGLVRVVVILDQHADGTGQDNDHAATPGDVPDAPGAPPPGPPEWPPRADAESGSPAARLAELIRQDPSLLLGTPEG